MIRLRQTAASADSSAPAGVTIEAGLWLQHVRPEHWRLLEEWIAADPDHRGQTVAAWLEPQGGVQQLVAVDRSGPLMFIRCSNAMRLDIQFSPETRMRTALALKDGLPFLARMFRAQGYRELIYESGSPRLVDFLQRLGFRESSTEHVMLL